MFGDVLTISSLVGGVILFFYVMAKLNKNGAMENVGLGGAVVVFSITMTIALTPAMMYENHRKAIAKAEYEELMSSINRKK